MTISAARALENEPTPNLQTMGRVTVNPPTQKNSARKRTAVRAFVIGLVALIAIDTAPFAMVAGDWPLGIVYDIKLRIRPVLRAVGLWQGEWQLFAPNPVLSNSWWTIEVKGRLAGELDEVLGQSADSLRLPEGYSWNSPFWGEVSALEKTYKRRHVAYFRRMSEFPRMVVRDYMDYWVRERFGDRLKPMREQPSDYEHGVPVEEKSFEEPADLELIVYRNEMKLAFPDDGSLPNREETTWMSVTEKYVHRRYAK